MRTALKFSKPSNDDGQAMDSETRICLGVVIVNYRTPTMVIDCLESLLPELAPISAKIAIVDNKSGDDSMLSIRSWCNTLPQESRERITLVESDKNGGFAAGNNQGIRIIDAKYYLLLNSDTIVRPESIKTLMRKIESDEEIGLLGPRLEFLDGHPQESCFRDQGVTSEFLRGAQLSVAMRLFRHKVVAIEIGDTLSTIDWTSFACVLIRRQVFEQIGLLDENFFMYFEDAEFCRRARNAGWRIGHEPQARIVHLRGGSSSVKRRAIQKKRLPEYFYESRARYFMLRGGYPKLVFANICWLAGHALRQLKRFAGRKDTSASVSEWKDIWVLPKMTRS
ncbi:glycosyltransferase family 2 protein [Microbulbifer sp. YPW1]|uniref:glycosyltransferase family 2 protein n=1 Tax=Microbulbifer sp. YPW1 TaxID=2745199 RepID=UPI001599694A|nr:glycosyltransferase family 2 protein [Microbulbifer sp. YPW1]QKX16592.1 glycosyltransferase family 2 protein [Microbulbifer sp. YPW1]